MNDPTENRPTESADRLDELKEDSSPTEMSPQPPIGVQFTVSFGLMILRCLEFAPLCLECIGRQFSYLATGTDNRARAEAILLQMVMESHQAAITATIDKRYLVYGQEPLNILRTLGIKAHFEPAIQLYEQLQTEHLQFPIFECWLCNNLLSPSSIEKIAESIVESARGYEFDNFLVGTGVDPVLADREDELRVRFNLQNGEAFKANMNRLVGKQLNRWWGKPVQFQNPDLLIVVQLRKGYHLIELNPNPLFVKACYVKFVRNLPQTQWHCLKCMGSGKTQTGNQCDACQGTGLYYPESIESLISPLLVEEAGGIDSSFHGAGREDYDVRCLGKGRPFIIEIRNPKRRNLDLPAIQKKINNNTNGRVLISELSHANKKEVVQYKGISEFSSKLYHTLVYSSCSIDSTEFLEKLQQLNSILTTQPLHQRTPERVVHRRADRTRDKQIFLIEGKYIDPVHFFFKIKTQGGVYIKELVSGDNGRTHPSFTEIFGTEMQVIELDVVEIEHKSQ